MAELVSALYAKHLGQPALVVGGGPSAPGQLKSLATTWGFVIISANGHGFKLGVPVDYVFCKDHQHTETKALMEGSLRPHGRPIVSPHYWADYRTAEWPLQGNSGAQAIGLAAMMGCAPIIAIGFDCYQKGVYFHAPDGKNVSQGYLPGYWTSRMKRLRERLAGAVVRAPSGFVAETFGRYDPRERVAQPVIPACFDRLRDLRTHYVTTRSSFLIARAQTKVPAGFRLPVTEGEATRFVKMGLADS